jgi:lysyl-tRNA synthetase, class I
MFWADKIVEDIENKLKDKIASGEPLVIRDEKTASGRVHIGSMRGVAIHGIIADVLYNKGVSQKYFYEINDFDVMDGLPAYLDKKKYEPEMGKVLNTIPSPDPSAPNFAEYYGREFEDVIKTAGFNPEFTRASYLYKSGKMNDVIREALDGAAEIRKIYKEVSGSEKADDWHPISLVCENCGKIGTTRTSSWDGEKVTYKCEEKMVEWAKGCGHERQASPFDGNAKLPWKVEWAAKWKVVGVDIEGAGKDHSTKGGARDVANHISRKVFKYQPPYDIPYEFFLVGGAKMSSSKGQGASAVDISKLLPVKILRLVLLGTLPKRAINLDPEGDTIPVWFDWYDRIAEKFWSGEKDDDARLFELVHEHKVPKEHYLPRFSTVAFLAQMEHLNLEEEIANVKEKSLNEIERVELVERAEYARSWLEKYAPEKYKFELQETLPAVAKGLSDMQKEGLRQVLEYVESKNKLDGQEAHHDIHSIRKGMDIEPKEFFSAFYLITLGKDHGPKVGWFLSVLNRDFLIKRLKEASKLISTGDVKET